MTRETIAKFVDAFLADDAEECHKPEYENLAALVTMTYTESAWRTAMKCGAPEPPMPTLSPRHESAVLDAIMSNAYSGEPLEVSLSRLAKAVQQLGFPSLTAFSATAAYNTFPQLSESYYVPQNKRRTNRRPR